MDTAAWADLDGDVAALGADGVNYGDDEWS